VEALLLTAGMLGAMVVALALIARFWPRSSHLGGYRVRGGAEDGAPPVREDDDAHWSWTRDERDDADPKDTPPRNR
jgi:hypothetical protein